VLVRTHELAGLGETEPAAPVDFGNDDSPTRARRPIDLAGVADEAGRIAIPGEGPSGDEFPIALAYLPEREKGSRSVKSGLFVELADGRVERILRWIVFTFRYSPDTLVLAGKVGSAGMNEEDLELRVRSVHEQASAGERHDWILKKCSPVVEAPALTGFLNSIYRLCPSLVLVKN